MSARVLIHVQHLLGTGHLKRIASVGSALADSGFDVEIASGGRPIAALNSGRARVTQLPSLRAADITFKNLVDENDRRIDDAWRASRRAALTARYEQFRPDAVIIELYPFGRRMLDFELVPLIEKIRGAPNRPLLLCSVRDILVESTKAHKEEQTIQRCRDWFDRILVHGDERLVGLQASYPKAAALANLVYTGYVTPTETPPPPPGVGDAEIIVSTGGGAVGSKLFDVACAAQQTPAGGRHVWRLLLGPNLPAADRDRLLAAARPGLIVENARPDFPNMLRRCHVSVSQAGYNTVMDVLVARCRAVFVPIAASEETEQYMRAQLLADRGWAVCRREDAIDAQSLAAAVDQAAALAPPDVRALNCDGAAQTARIVRDLLAAREDAQ